MKAILPSQKPNETTNTKSMEVFNFDSNPQHSNESDVWSMSMVATRNKTKYY